MAGALELEVRGALAAGPDGDGGVSGAPCAPTLASKEADFE